MLRVSQVGGRGGGSTTWDGGPNMFFLLNEPSLRWLRFIRPFLSMLEHWVCSLNTGFYTLWSIGYLMVKLNIYLSIGYLMVHCTFMVHWIPYGQIAYLLSIVFIMPGQNIYSKLGHIAQSEISIFLNQPRWIIYIFSIWSVSCIWPKAGSM